MSWVPALPAPVLQDSRPRAGHAAHQFMVSGRRPCEDVGTVAFDGARAQSERFRNFLGAFAERNSFSTSHSRPVRCAWSQRSVGMPPGVREVSAFAALPRGHVAGLERLCNKIEGAAAHGIDGEWDAGFRRTCEHSTAPHCSTQMRSSRSNQRFTRAPTSRMTRRKIRSSPAPAVQRSPRRITS